MQAGNQNYNSKTLKNYKMPALCTDLITDA